MGSNLYNRFLKLFLEAEVAAYPLLPVLLLAGVLCWAGCGVLGQPHPPRGAGQVHLRHRAHGQARGARTDSGQYSSW